MAYYGVNYWLKKGLSSEEAKLRSEGLSKCTICGTLVKHEKKHNGGQVFCSEVCQEEATRLRIERYKKTCSKRKSCEFCGSPMSKRASLHLRRYICSETCLTTYRASLPKHTSPLSYAYWIEKGLSENEAKAKVSELQRLRSPASIDYWKNKGCSDEEARLKANDYQRKSAAGVAKLTDYERRRRSHLCPEYWEARGLTREDAELAASKGNFSPNLEGFVERFGITEGKKRHESFRKITGYWNSVESYIERFGETEGIERWSAKFHFGNATSKFATGLFEDVLRHIDIPDVGIYFRSEDRKEFGRRAPDGKYYFYDFVIPNLRLCIELNGSYWHADPERYKSGDIIRHNKRDILVDEIWERDRLKRQILEDDHYEVIQLWFRKRSDYKELLSSCIAAVERKCIAYGVNYEKTDCSKKDV